MSTHLIPAAAPIPATGPRGAWLRLSAALTEQVADLADRDDLTVTCAPGAGRGAPGCFIPALASVELDGTHLGQDPATCDPARPSDRDRYPALWGVLVHEAAHARHSRWTALGEKSSSTASAAQTEAAMALEESRIEAAQLRRRPADRRWLRASASQLILADFRAEPDTLSSGAPAEPPEPRAAMTPWDAGRAAALLLARADAGILDSDETTALAETVTQVLGPSRLAALAGLWHLAHDALDDDHETMLELGRRWCRIVGADPDHPPPQESGEDSGQRGDPSPLAKAITASLTAVATSDAPPMPSGPDKKQQRRKEAAARRRAEQVARRVFAPGDPRGESHADSGRRGPTAITGTRRPRPDEQAAARHLARQLRAAAHRERVTTTMTSAAPAAADARSAGR